MKCPWRILLSIAFLVLVGQAGLRASSVGGVPSLTPAQKAVADAASVRDPRQREEALRQAIRDGLLASNRQTRDEVFRFLSESLRWIDLRPYGDVVEEFAARDNTQRGFSLLDDNDLMRAARHERLEIYRSAIENGVRKLGRGRPLSRGSAISLAAFEGITELLPLTEKFAGAVD